MYMYCKNVYTEVYLQYLGLGEGVGASGVIIGAEPKFWEPSRNSWLRTVSWPPEHVQNGSKQCLLSFLSNIDFFSGRF